MSWSAPVDGGAPMGYALYAAPLAGPAAPPLCETDLGSSTPALLPALPDGHGFLVVARNSLGEGPYGRDSEGLERAPAQGGDVCP